MGKRSSFQRRERDFYPTPEAAVAPLLSYLHGVRSFAEPCCGNGRLVRHLESHGLICVYSGDITTGQDALARTDYGSPDVNITNPPFTYPLLHQLISHFVKIAPTWLLLEMGFATNERDAALLASCTDVVPVGRVRWIEGTKFTSMENFGWFHFQQGHHTGPRLHLRGTPAVTGRSDRLTSKSNIQPVTDKNTARQLKESDTMGTKKTVEAAKPDTITPAEAVIEPEASDKSESKRTATKATAEPVETVGDLADIASLAIDQKHAEAFANEDEAPPFLGCRKPPKGVYFTVRKETPGEKWKDRGLFFVLEIEGRDLYLVAANIANLKKEEDVIRPLLITRFVTMAGEEGLWPTKLDQPDTKSNRWNRTAQKALAAAENQWIRLINAKTYWHWKSSPQTLEEKPPNFSNRSFSDLIKQAFEDRIVTTLEHEIWKALDEGSDK
jgi:hypothetical protein